MKKIIEIRDVDSNNLDERHFLNQFAKAAKIEFDPVDNLVGIRVPTMGRGHTAVYYFDLSDLMLGILESVKDYVEESIE